MLRLSRITALAEVPAAAWDRLAGTANPFICHAFLNALETQDCLHPYGWQPTHLLAWQGDVLVGAVPLYLKTNSYGEFVFDWAWASAYERSGLAYYPKLVGAVPYTPATGPRLLVAPQADAAAIKTLLIQGIEELTRSLGFSSAHLLFTDTPDTAALAAQGWLLRLGCQFHWENQGYRDFDDYLDAFVSKKRKQIRRERRDAQNFQGEIVILDGHTATDSDWAAFHGFYTSTFERKSGTPTLQLNFFKTLAETIPEAIVLVMARQGTHSVAGAFNLRGTDTLYGRHYGCGEHFRHLHFELCYYQTLDYCIQHGLQRFEAGAQGEHKLSRGFLPKPTWSAHQLAQPQFASAVQRFLAQETPAMQAYIEELHTHSPFSAQTSD